MSVRHNSWPNTHGLNNSVVKRVHRYCKGYGFEPHSG